jgi:hypothetical protein
MEPGKPPVKSTGNEETRSILGDRFLASDYTGTMMGKPFLGHGVSGYDLSQNKYVMFWIDSMGTWFNVMTGTADAAGKVITYTGECFDPMAGKKTPQRWVVTMENDNKHTMAFFGPGPDGKEMKMGEIVYTRAP